MLDIMICLTLEGNCMKSSSIKVENVYQCTSPLLKNKFSAKVINKLDHSCIVEMTDVAKEDENVAKELQYKTVVNFQNFKEK